MNPTEPTKSKRTTAQVAQDELDAVRERIKRVRVRKAKAEQDVADAVRWLVDLERLEAYRASHPALAAPQDAGEADEPRTYPVHDNPQA